MENDFRYLIGLQVDTPRGIGLVLDIRGDYVFVSVHGLNHHFDLDDILFFNGLRRQDPDERDIDRGPDD